MEALQGVGNIVGEYGDGQGEVESESMKEVVVLYKY